MSSRRELLEDLLSFRSPVGPLRSALAEFGWDSEVELARFDRAAAQPVLRRYLEGELTAAQIEEWANAIECRDDVGFPAGPEGAATRELLHVLANPYLTSELTHALASEWIDRLSSQRADN